MPQQGSLTFVFPNGFSFLVFADFMMAFTMFLTYHILLILAIPGCFCLITTIKVNFGGQDVPECLQNSSLVSCRTLNFVFNNIQSLNNTEIRLGSGPYTIGYDFQFKHVREFYLLADQAATSRPRIVCNMAKESVGLNFEYSRRLTFKYLEITECGSRRQSTSFGHPYLYAGMYLTNCVDLFFEDVIFRRNTGVGINMYDVGGKVVFRHVHFIMNADRSISNFSCPMSPGNAKFKSYDDMASNKYKANDIRIMKKREFDVDEEEIHDRDFGQRSGGGIYVEFTSCGAFPPFNCSEGHQRTEYNLASNFVFDGCVFQGNVAEYDSDAFQYRARHITFGRGGGLSVFFKGVAANNTFHISNCTFKRNCAIWGAGFYAESQDFSHGNSIYIEKETVFQENNATLAGGGVRFVSDSNNLARTNLQNKIHFRNSFFLHNAALWGGGLSLAGNAERQTNESDIKSRTVHILKCRFEGNLATVGSAIGAVSDNFINYKLGVGVPYVIALDSSIVKENKIQQFGDNVIGQGAVYCESVPILLQNKVVFEGNSMTALVLVSSSVSVYSHAIFKRNFGFNGGAIALYGNSKIFVVEGSFLSLSNNTAKNKGGAWFVQSSSPPRLAFVTTQLATSTCFVRYITIDDRIEEIFNPSLWKCKIEFFGNTASYFQGKSIYADTLQNCRRSGENRYNIRSLETTPFVYDKLNDSSTPHIVTSAVQINFFQEDWNQSPSMEFSPKLSLTDELSNSVFGVVNFTLVNTTTRTKLDSPSWLFRTHNKLQNISMTGAIQSEFHFQFITTEGQIVSSNVGKGSLIDCPLGYFQKPGSTKCTCLRAVEGSGVVQCFGKQIFLLRGLWGYPNNSYLQTTPCPKHYCKCKNRDTLNIDYMCEFDNDKQCALGRIGTLCGKCKDGLSVELGGERCKKCTNLSLLVLLPMIVGLSFMVITVMYLNVDAFSGYLNSYFYSYQVMNLLLTEKERLDPFIGFVIGTTGISGTGGSFGVCLFNGMDDLDKFWVNYALASYIVLFTIMLGVFLPNKIWVKAFSRGRIGSLTDIRSHSFGRAFAFVCVFCYFWYTNVSINVLHFVKINQELKVFQAGHFNYFEGKHLFLGITAILVIIFIVIGFPVVLIFSSFFVRNVRWIQRSESILDNLRDCFKNKMHDGADKRYFSAFYFICRLIVLAFATVIQAERLKLIVLALISVLILFIFCWSQPYKVWTMNLWDSILLLNLSLISLLSLIVSIPYATSAEVSIFLRIVTKVLIYVPLVSIFLRGIAFAISYQRRERRNEREYDETSTSACLIERQGGQRSPTGDIEAEDDKGCSFLKSHKHKGKRPRRSNRKVPYRVTEHDAYHRAPDEA